MIDLCQEPWYSISVKKINLEFEHNSYKDTQKSFKKVLTKVKQYDILETSQGYTAWQKGSGTAIPKPLHSG